MTAQWLVPVMDWVAAHAHWAGPLLGLIAFAESLALVGLFVPGAVLMFAAGALIGAGRLELWSMIAWAAGGAVLGDGLSFWLGRHFGSSLRERWPFRSHPTMLDRGVAFFRTHGGKSIVLGRFVGPVRPIIPAVAGMLHMPAGRFFLVNVISAVAWAPAYLLPGMVFAASLSVAAAVTGRLAMIVVALVALGWLLWWLGGAVRPGVRRFGGVLATPVRGLRLRSPWLREALLPLQVALRALRYRTGLAWWAGVAVLVACLAAAGVDDGDGGWRRGVVELAAAHRPQLLRWPLWLLTGAAELFPVLAAAVGVTLWLVSRRRPVAALAVVASTGLALLGALSLTPILAGSADVPQDLRVVALAGLNAVCVACAVIAAPPARRGREGVFIGVLALLVLIAVSMVWLGQAGPLQAVAGVALGGICGAVPALLRRHRLPARQRMQPLLLALVISLGTGAVAGALGARAVAPVADSVALPRIEASNWPEASTALPTVRQGLLASDGVFQALWPVSAEELAGRARRAGWTPASPWGLEGALRWLSPEPDLGELPPIPRWHAGRTATATWVRPLRGGHRLVLRAWPVARVDTGAARVWALQIEDEYVSAAWPFVVVETRGMPALAVRPLLAGLSGRRLAVGDPPWRLEGR
ncbi:MAG: DedA family protein [Ectothiorhodospiraceae bacterium]|jgi:undecaprenyl-diphosphatase